MRWALIGAVAILVFDGVLAVASQALGFEYGTPLGLVGSTAIYAIPSFVAARERERVRVGVAAGAVIAAVDVTLGWPLSTALGATDGPRDLAEYLAVGVMVAGVGALAGWVAGVVGVRAAKRAAGVTGGE